MRTYLDCIPCFFKQALKAARMAGADEDVQKKILDNLAAEVPNFPLSSSPPEMGRIVYRLVTEITGEEDPFKKVKDKYNKLALNIYPDLKDKVAHSKDRLLTAIRLAVAGNIIDFGVDNPFVLEKEIEDVFRKDFAIFDYQEFKETLKNAKRILYLADNAGEIVFDRILIEELNREVICVVRDKPVINDALIEDAKFCGIDKIAKVVSNGSDAPGTILDLCSRDFLSLYAKAKLIISKGQGNFEGLWGKDDAPVFFLFKVKCPIIAHDIGCKVDDIVLKYNCK
jgi:damage-control phosphatase, subfamily I